MPVPDLSGPPSVQRPRGRLLPALPELFMAAVDFRRPIFGRDRLGLDRYDARPRPPSLLPGPWSEATSGPSTAERAMLEELQQRLNGRSNSGKAENLGGLLARWDVGRWPLIVDKEALEAAGIGPKTRSPDLDARGPFARGTLAKLGLRIVPIDTVLLATTPSMAPRFAATMIGEGGRSGRLGRSLREAVIAWLGPFGAVPDRPIAGGQPPSARRSPRPAPTRRSAAPMHL